ncbi:MAG: ABC transporter ATP-binding protein [Gaiellaceae bacterium]
MSVLARCRDAGVAYGAGGARVLALDGVDLEVRDEETVALLGRSGSGKTTLLHVLGGLVEPTSGAVERMAPASYVFQGANLLPHFTAYENVAFAGHVAPPAQARPERPEALLELVGLSHRLDSLPAELSGGEAQRVAIARALAQGSRLLLCDEPTGHLDSDTSERVLQLLEELQQTFGFALVVATHDPGVAARLERSVELDDGRIVEEPVEA